MLGLAAYGFWEGTPQDVVNAVRSGNVGALRKAVERDPAAVHTKVYAQAFERQSDRSAYQARTGRSPWEGKYLIHEAVGRIINPEPMLDALAAAGADLAVRLNGRNLLHLAAHEGAEQLVQWLKPAGGCAIVSARARAARSPVSDDDARQVFAETVPRRR